VETAASSTERHLAVRVAHAIVGPYRGFRRRFASITRRAAERFEAGDARGMQRDAVERLDLYEETISGAVTEIRRLLGGRVQDRGIWRRAKLEYRKQILAEPDVEIAETYFNSVTRRIFDTRGVDPAIEFLEPEPRPTSWDAAVRRVEAPESAHALVEDLVRHCRFQAAWVDLAGDLRLAARAVDEALAARGFTRMPDRVEVFDRIFFRGRGAFVVARAVAPGRSMPLVLAIHHTARGLVLGAVLTEPDDVSILFSYTRSSFHVDAPEPARLVQFLKALIPHRRISELYTAIGHRKHGKTEMYRDLMAHVARSGDRFTFAPGIPGLVMIVFTLPGYDVVFKVIRDRFPSQKHVTPDEVRSKYRIVSRHDRAGRLVDAQEFEHLRFPAARFDPALLDQLRREAARSVSIAGDGVVLHRVYIERRVTPLDIYVRMVDEAEARRAIVDYGTAIKNLAATNIFPGDMLIKNFGVTRSGRVVFYDYDELRLLTECTFRRLPVSDDPYDEMASEPWFGVGEADVFPEEFGNFLGVGLDLRAAFEARHRDLYDVAFWQRIQERIVHGEPIDIRPYRRSLALRG